MKAVFADTFYWIALLNPKDTWHSQVIEYSRVLENFPLVITDGIIDELFAHYSKSGELMRGKVAELYRNLFADSNIKIVAYSEELRRAGIELYRQRPDKGYSLTDCISMVVMKRLGISEVLTNDKHFAQEGFTIIFNR
jgi:predicted nucleic acid-binding protein